MATCPLCDYEGPSRSVEAHISGKADDAHAGRIGRQYRARIRETVGEGQPDLPAEEGPPDVGEGGLSPTLSVVAATVVLAVAVVASADGEGEPELSPAELEDDSAASPEAW
jgi:hypothetical protein